MTTDLWGVQVSEQYDQYRMRFDTGAGKSLSVARGRGAISSVSREATGLAVDVLKDGGNAFDAAFVLAFALAVCHPQAGNLGGGGYLIFKEAQSDVPVVYNFRERSSANAKRQDFLNDKGEVDPELTAFGPPSVCVPGTVQAFFSLQQRYGVCKTEDLLGRLADLAKRGCRITDYQAQCLNRLRPKLKQSPGSRKIYVKEQYAYQRGDLLQNPDLANTFETLARSGAASFYQGEIAERIEQSLTDNGGFVNVKDLKNHEITISKPVATELNGYIIWTVPPEGGGTLLIEIINILKREGFLKIKPYTSDFYHFLAQAAKMAFIDRMDYMGDCPFEQSDTYTAIFSDESTGNRFNLIDADRDIPTEEYMLKLEKSGIADMLGGERGGSNTTHFSIVDSQGNAVSNSYTLNLRYGSKWTIDGTGILMNGSTDSFSFIPGKPNYFGVIGNSANLFAPNKRPASNMSPVLVTKGKEAHLLIGTPGGPTIPTSIAAVLFSVLAHGVDPQVSIGEGRTHHQAWPDTLFREDDKPLKEKVDALAAKGYTIEQRHEPIGDMHGVFRDKGGYIAISDHRREGGAGAL